MRTGCKAPRPLTRLGEGVRSVVYAPNGRQIASSDGAKLCVHDVRTMHTRTGSYEWETYKRTRVAYSPDGTRICSCESGTGAIYIWEVHSGKRVAGPLLGHPDTSENYEVIAAYSFDGARIISAHDVGIISVWDAHGQAARDSLAEGHTDSLNAVSFSPDGTRIASASSDKTVCVWDMHTGRRLLGPLEGHTTEVLSIDYPPDGSRIVSASFGGTLIVWDAQTGQMLRSAEFHSRGVGAVAYFPNQMPFIVSGSWGPTMHVWDENLRQPVLTIVGELHAYVQSVACSPDGAYIASGCGPIICLWSVDDKYPTEILQGHKSTVLSVAYSPDGRHIASGSEDKTVCTWSVHTRQVEVGPIKWHTDGVNAVAYSPNGVHVASGSEDGTICVWDARLGNMVAGPLLAHGVSIRSMKYSPNSAYIAAGTSNGTIHVWCPNQPGRETEPAWKFNEDGWVVDTLSQRLIWVPPGLRENLITPGEVLRISTRRSLSIDFDGVYLGQSWADCQNRSERDASMAP